MKLLRKVPRDRRFPGKFPESYILTGSHISIGISGNLYTWAKWQAQQYQYAEYSAVAVDTGQADLAQILILCTKLTIQAKFSKCSRAARPGKFSIRFSVNPCQGQGAAVTHGGWSLVLMTISCARLSMRLKCI